MEYRLFNGDLVRVGGAMYDADNNKCFILAGDEEDAVVTVPVVSVETRATVRKIKARLLTHRENRWSAQPKATNS